MSDQALLHRWYKLSGAVVRLVEGAPDVAVLPRAKTHWITLDVRGIPRRFLNSSLRLQLRKFLGLDGFSFAYSENEGTASIWYWLESDERSLGDEGGENAEPWPEALLRPTVGDGMHLIRCCDGFEAVYVRSRTLVRTRWFPKAPASDLWEAFVQDSGLDPSNMPMPLAMECKLAKEPPSDWRVSSRKAPSFGGVAWGAVGLAAIFGMLVVAGCALSLKLSAALSVEKARYEKLMQEHAVTISLQRNIDEKRAYLDGFSGLRSSYSQLELIKAVIDAGLLSEKARVSLAEWEFKNNRLRLLFSVPQDGFRLGGFLSVLEKQPMFKDLSLMPDTPAGTVGVQLAVVAPGVAGTAEIPHKTDSAASSSTP